MFIDSVQPTNNISCKARLLYDPQTMEIVKRMACVAPLALWTALNLLERSPKKDTIALRCEQHYDTAKKTSSEFYSAQNVITKAEIPLHNGKNIKNTCVDAVETFCDYISKPHKVLFMNATDVFKKDLGESGTKKDQAKNPYELAIVQQKSWLM